MRLNSIIVAVFWALSVWPTALAAQIPTRERVRPLEGLLFLVPVPEDKADSAYSVEVAAHMRERFGRWHRHEANLIEFCEETESCGALVPDTSAHHYARSVGADFYVFGSFSRRPNPSIRLRIHETGRRGGIQHHLATVVVRAESQIAAQSFAGMVNRVLSDTLGPAIAAARDARDCWEEVVDRQYESATAQAMGALRRFPNHPSAASCLAYIYGATDRADSLVWSLERAAAGDSSLTHVWERLGEVYLSAGDTVSAVAARMREVGTDPNDVQRRVRIARTMDEFGRRDEALQLLSGGVERAGDNVELRKLLVRMCIQYEMWDCALANMSSLYALDSSLVGDTTFYFQMIGLAQAMSDPDKAIWWTEEAVKQVDSLVDVAWEQVEEQRRAAERVEDVYYSLRFAHAGTLRDMGRKDSALVVYRGIMMEDPDNVRARLEVARLLSDGRSFGPGALTPTDSQILYSSDSLLAGAAALSEDPEVLQTVALLYLDVGSRLSQNRATPNHAAAWLEKALLHDQDGSLAARGNAILTVVMAYLVEDTDGELRTEPSCSLVDAEAVLIDRGLAAAAEAQEEYSDAVDELAGGLRAYAELIPQLRAALGCDGARPAARPNPPE
jgi:tetratricopeptide (TPR) repeat protein